DDLLGEARIGDDLLVAGHRGREDGFAEGESFRADRFAGEDAAILESEKAFHCSSFCARAFGIHSPRSRYWRARAALRRANSRSGHCSDQASELRTAACSRCLETGSK